MSAVRARLVSRVVEKMRKAKGMKPSNVVGIRRDGYYGGQNYRSLGAFDWGSLIGEIVGKVGDVHVNRAKAKADAKAAAALARLETEQMLAETERQLALAQSMNEQVRLAQEQKQLQQMLSGMDSSGLYKVLIVGGIGAGLIMLVMATRKRGRR